MKCFDVIGHSEGFVSFLMRCSECGFNLHPLYREIERGSLRYCPKCGHRLQRRSRRVRDTDIVRMLNNQHTVIAEAPRNCDRYRTEDEAKAAFDAGFFGPTDFGFYEAAFIHWLFAKAEGGAK